MTTRTPRARKPRKLTLAELFATYQTLDAVILAVDTGATSGWCIMHGGIYVDSGEFDVYSDGPRRAVEAAVRLAGTLGLPCFMACERPFAANTASAAGMGAAFGVWKAAWYSAGGVKARLVRVYPSSWRARVLPKGCATAPREVVRPIEQAAARTVKRGGGEVGKDEAPAIMIGVWASRAPELAKKMPKRKPRKALDEVAA